MKEIRVRIFSKINKSAFPISRFKTGEGTYIGIAPGVWITLRFMEQGYLDIVACDEQAIEFFRRYILGIK